MSAPKETVTHARLLELLDYSPGTGEFRWKVKRNSRGGQVLPGTLAGRTSNRGYREIGIDGVLYRSSRLAWFYVHKAWPKERVGHIDNVTTNDRIESLKDATHAEIMQNKSVNKTSGTGLKGVGFDKRRELYFARICVDRKVHHLGYFETAEEARARYVSASHEMHDHSTERI